MRHGRRRDKYKNKGRRKSMNDIFGDIRDYLVREHFITSDDVTMDTKLTDLGLDSFDKVEMVMDLEDMFEVEMTDTESQQIITIKDAVDIIKNKRRRI
jgi:acyl carrier protein